MIKSILATKIFFHDVLQELDGYLKKSTQQKAVYFLLLLTNGMSMVMAFLGVKKDRVSSAILSNLVVLSFFASLSSDTAFMRGTSVDSLVSVYTFAAFEIAFLCMAFVLSEEAKFFLLSLSFSLRATNMLEECTRSETEPVLVMLVGIYMFVASYLFLYLLPGIGWAVIYSTVGSLFFCYTVEVLFGVDCGIRGQLLQNGHNGDVLADDGDLRVLYLTMALSVLLQVACSRRRGKPQNT